MFYNFLLPRLNVTISVAWAEGLTLLQGKGKLKLEIPPSGFPVG